MMLKVISCKGSNSYGEIGVKDDVAVYATTEVVFELKGKELRYNIGGEIKDPKAWFLNHALNEVVHWCGHHDLIPKIKAEEKDFVKIICEDDAMEFEYAWETLLPEVHDRTEAIMKLHKMQHRCISDLRTERVDYSNTMCYNSDIFFTYLSLLKGRVKEEDILDLYYKIIKIQDVLQDKELESIIKEYDDMIHKKGELISLISFIIREKNLSF